MGAVKELCIELESNMFDAAERATRLDDPGLAYRLGLLEACRLIAQQQAYYIETRATGTPFQVLHDAWRDVLDSAEYLREAAYR